MYCPKCGNEIANEAKFCPKCGSVTQVGKVVINEQKKEQAAHRTSKVGKIFAGIGFGLSIGALLCTAYLVLVDFKFAAADNSAERLTYAMLFLLFFIFAYAFDVASLVLSIIGLRKATKKVLAVLGIVFSVVSIVAGLTFLYVVPLLRV